MSLVIQALIWIIGVGLTAYLAVFQMFIGGLVDVISNVADIAKNTDTSGAAKDLAWGIAKIVFASLTGWFILLATSLVSAFAGEFLD